MQTQRRAAVWTTRSVRELVVLHEAGRLNLTPAFREASLKETVYPWRPVIRRGFLTQLIAGTVWDRWAVNFVCDRDDPATREAILSARTQVVLFFAGERWARGDV